VDDQDLVFNFSYVLHFLQQRRMNCSSFLLTFHFWMLGVIILHPEEIKPYSECAFMKNSGLFNF